MDVTTQSVSWPEYVFSEAEFRKLLGIEHPDRFILSIHQDLASHKIFVRMESDK